MVEIEGEGNVSAHRGYIDLVIKYVLDPADGRKPPVFEAEWIQDPDTTADVQTFDTFSADEVEDAVGVDFDAGVFYGYSDGDIRQFNIEGLREVYSVPISGLGGNTITSRLWRYIKPLNRILTVRVTFLGAQVPVLINPQTGVITAAAADSIAGAHSQLLQASCAVMTSATTGILAIGSSNQGYFSIFRFTSTGIVRLLLSGTNWDSRGAIVCIAPGEVRSTGFDLWLCAGGSLWKMVLTTSGAIISLTSHVTPADAPVYAVYWDGDVLIWTNAAGLIRVDGTTAATVYSTTVPYQIHPNGIGTSRDVAEPDYHRLTAGNIYINEGGFHAITDFDTGETTTGASFSTMAVWDSETQTAIATDDLNEPARRIRFDIVGDGTLRDLDDFLAALTEVDNGFSSSQHLELNITDQIQGAVIDVTTGVRDVARNTCGPYRIAIFDRAGKIIYKRALTDGSFAVDFTLASSDFIDRAGQAIVATRKNPREFVARYGIAYRDPDEIYQTKTQYGEIQFTPFPLSPTDKAIKADTPIIHDADTIKTLATKRIQRMAVEQHDFSFGLRAKYFDIEPEDIPQFTYAGRTINARVTEMTLNPNFTVNVVCTEFLTKVAATVAGAVGRPTAPLTTGNPASAYYHLDIPLLSDGDDLGGAGLVQYHVLTSQGQSNWRGATLYRQEGTYLPVSTQTVEGLIGVALEVLPDCEISPYTTEFTRTLNVAFVAGDTTELASATYLEVMNGANKFAIGAPGRWEVCQVIDITDNGDGTWTFEGLVRGRGVSEEHTDTHQLGDYVVWLSGDNVQNVDYAISALNDAFNYKPVGIGGTLSGTTAVSETVTGEAEKIPKPAQLDAAIGSPSDIRFSWVRCSRIGVYWPDDGSDTYTTPLGETLEQYVLRIKDGPGGTVLRTVTVNDAELYDYPGDLQTTDFGAPLVSGDDVTFDIRQVSGTGVTCPTREKTITL